MGDWQEVGLIEDHFLIDKEEFDKLMKNFINNTNHLNGTIAGDQIWSSSKDWMRESMKKDDYMFENTGKIAINKRTGDKCIIIKEHETGQILVCESVKPTVFCTHDSWDTLELVEE